MTRDSYYNHQGHIQLHSFIQQIQIEHGIKNYLEVENIEAKKVDKGPSVMELTF